MIVIAIAALVATAVPGEAPPVVVVPARPPAAAPSKLNAVPDLTKMFAAFDKLFPPQAEPDPARLSLARITVQQGLLRSGSFGRAMGAMMGTMVDRVLAMKDSISTASFRASSHRRAPSPNPRAARLFSKS